MSLIKPNYPPTDPPVEFLASFGMTEAELKNLCIETVEVIGISSLEEDTVKVLYDRRQWSNIPVWIHTDEGCYANRYKDTPQGLAKEYFKGAARMFICSDKANALTWNSISRIWHDCNQSVALNKTYAYCLVNTTSGLPKAVIGIKEHLNASSDFRTYRPLLGIECHRDISTDPRVYIFDMMTGEIASIINQTLDGFVDADYGTSWADYEQIIKDDSINNYPGCTRLVTADYSACGILSDSNITNIQDGGFTWTVLSGANGCQDVPGGTDVPWDGPYTDRCNYDKTVDCAASEYEKRAMSTYTATNIPDPGEDWNYPTSGGGWELTGSASISTWASNGNIWDAMKRGCGDPNASGSSLPCPNDYAISCGETGWTYLLAGKRSLSITYDPGSPKEVIKLFDVHTKNFTSYYSGYDERYHFTHKTTNATRDYVVCGYDHSDSGECSVNGEVISLEGWHTGDFYSYIDQDLNVTWETFVYEFHTEELELYGNPYGFISPATFFSDFTFFTMAIKKTTETKTVDGPGSPEVVTQTIETPVAGNVYTHSGILPENRALDIITKGVSKYLDEVGTVDVKVSFAMLFLPFDFRTLDI